MIPLKDENPIRITPFITFAIIAACVLMYFGPQEGVADEARALDFNLEYAAIPCELRTGDPLSVEEIEATFDGGDFEACVTDDTTESAFPSKVVYLGAITSMFLHSGLLHLFGNMWSLWIFGNNIEDRLGHFRYLIFYLVGGVVATVAYVAVQPSSTVPVVGASGAVAAIMGAYLVWFPNAPIRTLIFFFLRDVSAKWFLGFWFVSQFFTGGNSEVAWMAHVGGFVFGVVIGLLVRTTEFGNRRVNRSDDSLEWDDTGGVGRGPLPHPFDNRRGDFQF